MRRRSVLLLTVVGIAVIGAGSIPWTLTSGRGARQITRDINAITGGHFTYDGAVNVAFLPAPSISVDGVRLLDSEGRELARARQLRTQLQIAPLLLGRVVMDDVTLVEPSAPAPVDASLDSLWARGAALLASLHRHGERGRTPPRRLYILGGALADASGGPGRLRDVNGVVRWPSSAGAISVTGTGRYAGETVEFSLTGLAPRVFAGGAAADIDLRLSSPLVRASLRGALGDGARRLDGQAEVTTPDLARLDAWLGLQIPFAAAVPASLSGACAISGRGFALSTAKVRLGDNSLEGALTFRPADRGGWAVSGTLAADSLDLRQIAVSGWTERPRLLTPEGIQKWNLDLRLSASAVRLPQDMRATDVAASILAHSGRLEAVLGAATTLGGTLKGRLAVTPGARGIDIRTQVAMDQIDVGQAPFLKSGGLRLKGALGGSLTIETGGDAPDDLLQRLQGHGQFHMSEGELTGVNIPELLRGAARQRPETVRLRGRTAFRNMKGAFSLSTGGRFRLDDLIAGMGSPETTIAIEGDLARESDGSAFLGRMSVTGADPNTTLFRLSGDWSAPTLTLSPTPEPAPAPMREGP